ncbi:MAG: hydrogenase nickel incorporation protein HypB [Spirochaetales bacterium]|nr:MAG: hydrogenase nickel incorporation protein HypB [Spirochaetales bacterium]
MSETRIVRVRESILQENRVEASAVRSRLDAAGVVMVNIMASPGAGKTSVILKTIDALQASRRIAVIEADIDSTVDSDKMTAIGIPAVQIETGGLCHVAAAMTSMALAEVDLEVTDLLILENVGNLICTAGHDTGAHVNVAILSVPEGDDKPLKYPVMFTAVDAVIINKIDFLDLTDFDMSLVKSRIGVLNANAPIFPVSCRTGAGIDDWIRWLESRLRP